MIHDPFLFLPRCRTSRWSFAVCRGAFDSAWASCMASGSCGMAWPGHCVLWDGTLDRGQPVRCHLHNTGCLGWRFIDSLGSLGSSEHRSCYYGDPGEGESPPASTACLLMAENTTHSGHLAVRDGLFSFRYHSLSPETNQHRLGPERQDRTPNRTWVGSLGSSVWTSVLRLVPQLACNQLPADTATVLISVCDPWACRYRHCSVHSTRYLSCSG